MYQVDPRSYYHRSYYIPLDRIFGPPLVVYCFSEGMDPKLGRDTKQKLKQKVPNSISVKAITSSSSKTPSPKPHGA